MFAHRCVWDGQTVVAVHNLGDEAIDVELPLGEDGDDQVDGADDLLLGGRIPVEDRRLGLALDGYGYRWLRLHRRGERRTP